MLLPMLLSLAIGAGPSLPISEAQAGDAATAAVYFYFTSYTLPRGVNIGTPKIGRIIGRSPTAARQLASRARPVPFGRLALEIPNE